MRLDTESTTLPVVSLRAAAALTENGRLFNASQKEMPTNAAAHTPTSVPSRRLVCNSTMMETLNVITTGQKSKMSVQSVMFTPCDISLTRCASAPAKLLLKKRCEWCCK